jgi:hypothetical protein
LGPLQVSNHHQPVHLVYASGLRHALLPAAFNGPLFRNVSFQSFFRFFQQSESFFVGIFGSMVLAPEKFQFGAANLTSSYFGSEFLLTRSIDRPVLYRAKAAVLYLLVLSLPFIAIIYSLNKPNLIVDEYSKVVQQQCLAAVPASVLIPSSKKNPQPLISIPRGNVLVAEWQLWVMLIAAITLQLFILILYPFKYGRVVFWVLYFGLILVPLFDLTHLGKDEATVNEQLFFSFTAHQTALWILTALVFIFTQLWCERRFARLEQ